MNLKSLVGIGGASLAALGVIGLGAEKVARPGVAVAYEPERTPSYWTLTAPELPLCPKLEADIEVDVAVVGAGFAGLAIAYYLKTFAPELRVAVFESHRLGSGASSRNSGAVLPRFRGHTESISANRGYELLKAFTRSENIEFDLQEALPTLFLHGHCAPAGTSSLSGARLAQEAGTSFYPSATITASDSVHPGKLVAGLVQANLRLGVELYETTPVLGIVLGDRPCLQTPLGRVIARDIALATNAYTPRLGIADDVITAIHQRGMVTRPLTDDEWEMSGLARWPFRFEDGDHYTHTVRSTGDRRFFFRHALGHRAFEETHWGDHRLAREVGHRELVRRYPWLDGVSIEYEWYGVTARTRDWWPVAGQVDEHLYMAAGYNGSGVMAAHYFGHLVACRMLGADREDMGLLRPPAAHPRMLPELLRHAAWQSWFGYQRMRDGRGQG